MQHARRHSCSFVALRTSNLSKIKSIWNEAFMALQFTHHHWHDSSLWAIAFLGFSDKRIFTVGSFQPHAQPPTWRTRPPYLWPPETGWPSYTPRHWVHILVAFYDTHEVRWDYSYPPVTTRRLVGYYLSILINRRNLKLSGNPAMCLPNIWPDNYITTLQGSRLEHSRVSRSLCCDFRSLIDPDLYLLQPK
jgi:hypothetical protein